MPLAAMIGAQRLCSGRIAPSTGKPNAHPDAEPEQSSSGNQLSHT